MDKKIFCESLKKFFKDKGLTQNKIAEQLGVTQGYVTSILNGRNPLGKKNAHIWAETFGLSETWLLTGIGEMIPNNNSEETTLPEKDTKAAYGDTEKPSTDTGHDALITRIQVLEALIKEKDERIADLKAIMDTLKK